MHSHRCSRALDKRGIWLPMLEWGILLHFVVVLPLCRPAGQIPGLCRQVTASAEDVSKALPWYPGGERRERHMIQNMQYSIAIFVFFSGQRAIFACTMLPQVFHKIQERKIKPSYFWHETYATFLNKRIGVHLSLLIVHICPFVSHGFSPPSRPQGPHLDSDGGREGRGKPGWTWYAVSFSSRA